MDGAEEAGMAALLQQPVSCPACSCTSVGWTCPHSIMHGMSIVHPAPRMCAAEPLLSSPVIISLYLLVSCCMIQQGYVC